MLKPLEEWICDVCGKVTKKENGYVIWRTDKRQRYDFKIIHQTKCDLNDHPSSLPLEDFLGARGITNLLTHMSPGPIKRNLGDETKDSPKDFDEYVDFFRRVQVPYYEEARTKFSDPQLLEDHSDDNEFAPYLPDRLKAIIGKY